MERLLVPPRPNDVSTPTSNPVSEHYLHATSAGEVDLPALCVPTTGTSQSVFLNDKADKVSKNLHSLRPFVLKLMPKGRRQVQEALAALRSAGVSPRDVKVLENGDSLLLLQGWTVASIPVPLRPFGGEGLPVLDTLRCLEHFPQYFKISRRILVVPPTVDLTAFRATLLAYGFSVLHAVKASCRGTPVQSTHADTTGLVTDTVNPAEQAVDGNPAKQAVDGNPAKQAVDGNVLLVQSIARGLTFDQRDIACGIPLPSPTQVFMPREVPEKWKVFIPADKLETTCLVLFPHARTEPHMVSFIRKLLYSNCFFVVDERTRTLSQAEVAMLLGLPPRTTKSYPVCHPSICVLLENYTKGQSLIFIVRRTSAVQILLHLVFGHFELAPKRSYIGPLLPKWPFAQDGYVGGTRAIFGGLQSMATWWDNSPPSAPLVASCPFSHIHASMFLEYINHVAHCGEVAVIGATPEVVEKLTAFPLNYKVVTRTTARTVWQKKSVHVALLYKRFAQTEVRSLDSLPPTSSCYLRTAYRELAALDTELVTSGAEIDTLCADAFPMLRPGSELWCQRLKCLFADIWTTSSTTVSTKQCPVAGGTSITVCGGVQVSQWNSRGNAFHSALFAARALVCHELCGGFPAAVCLLPRFGDASHTNTVLAGLCEGGCPLAFTLQLFTDDKRTTVKISPLEARQLDLSPEFVVLRPTGNVEVGWRLLNPDALKSDTNPVSLTFATDHRAESTAEAGCHVSRRLHSKLEALVLGLQLWHMCEKVHNLQLDEVQLNRILHNSLGVAQHLPLTEWMRSEISWRKAMDILVPTEGLIRKKTQEIYHAWIGAIPDANYRPLLDELLNSTQFADFQRSSLRPCLDTLTSNEIFVSASQSQTILPWGCGLCLSLPMRVHAQVYVLLRCCSALLEWEQCAPGVPKALLMGFEKGVDSTGRLHIGFQSICILLESLEKPTLTARQREDLLRWLPVFLVETHNYWKEL